MVCEGYRGRLPIAEVAVGVAEVVGGMPGYVCPTLLGGGKFCCWGCGGICELGTWLPFMGRPCWLVSGGSWPYADDVGGILLVVWGTFGCFIGGI